MRRGKRKLVMICAWTAAALAGGAVLAEDVWVQSESVDIRAGKGAVYPVVATASKGAKLSVIAHEGKWLQVQAGDKPGYVFETAISASKVDGGGNLLANMEPSDSTNMSSGAAAKGLTEDADQYARSKNMDPKAMNRLIDYRKKIDPKDWEKFTAEGKVGPDAPNAQ
jgi:uncharacterized protein YraI